MFTLETFNIFIQIIFIDLVLAGDNAIIVGMVASRVPEHMRQRVIFTGIAAAVIMRIMFSLVAVQLLAITGLQLVGGLLLLWVCWRLFLEIREGQNPEEGAEGQTEAEQFTSLRPAIIQIVIALSLIHI